MTYKSGEVPRKIRTRIREIQVRLIKNLERKKICPRRRVVRKERQWSQIYQTRRRKLRTIPSWMSSWMVQLTYAGIDGVLAEEMPGTFGNQVLRSRRTASGATPGQANEPQNSPMNTREGSSERMSSAAARFCWVRNASCVFAFLREIGFWPFRYDTTYLLRTDLEGR